MTELDILALAIVAAGFAIRAAHRNFLRFLHGLEDDLRDHGE
ncbi:hypothetical protein [Megalodesulfovibrio gigas]|uniref:Uncharacterized protein n=1 Tax=Megalodesulfovibrio gigas (strain ATCC 19364 / DSM 1382 / NCIMB 9332 / VKM B-1759) TaxID=1121448 RepID=T2GC81_MEGG1|nr:hypothetical protein [Megalodesulfovibrio gigas]AGW13784.1 hypothetical protein DGI_2010 [Megalodesulfovibrio gigas DSM 1382 = ATCC 19364]